MKAYSKHTILGLFLLAYSQSLWSQGFVNLDFEGAKRLPPTPGPVAAADAIPNWMPYGGSATSIQYNNMSLGGAMISLLDSNAAFLPPLPMPLNGNYSSWLQAGFMGDTTPAAVGQIGTVPLAARSLTFWSDSSALVMTFGNQVLNYAQLSSTASYSVFVADISQYAGQTGELRFTAPTGDRGVLDNIQFSTVPVPEPGVLSLTAIWALLLLGGRKTRVK